MKELLIVFAIAATGVTISLLVLGLRWVSKMDDLCPWEREDEEE